MISGVTQDGQTLSVTSGTWDTGGTNSPPTFAYQWQRCDGAGLNCGKAFPAPPSTSPNYVLTDGDLGHIMVAYVTATSTWPGGSASDSTHSHLTTTVVTPGNTAAPTISRDRAGGSEADRVARLLDSQEPDGLLVPVAGLRCVRRQLLRNCRGDRRRATRRPTLMSATPCGCWNPRRPVASPAPGDLRGDGRREGGLARGGGNGGGTGGSTGGGTGGTAPAAATTGGQGGSGGTVTLSALQDPRAAAQGARRAWQGRNDSRRAQPRRLHVLLRRTVTRSSRGVLVPQATRWSPRSLWCSTAQGTRTQWSS